MLGLQRPVSLSEFELRTLLHRKCAKKPQSRTTEQKGGGFFVYPTRSSSRRHRGRVVGTSFTQPAPPPEGTGVELWAPVLNLPAQVNSRNSKVLFLGNELQPCVFFLSLSLLNTVLEATAVSVCPDVVPSSIVPSIRTMLVMAPTSGSVVPRVPM